MNQPGKMIGSETLLYADRGKDRPAVTPKVVTEKPELHEFDISLFSEKEIEVVFGSREHGWRDLLVVGTKEGRHASSVRACPFYFLTMNLTETRLRRQIPGQDVVADLKPFTISLIEPDTPMDYWVEEPFEALHVMFQPEVLYEVALERFGLEPDRVALSQVFGVDRPGLAQLLRTLGIFVQGPKDFSSIPADYLVRALCAELLSTYSVHLPETLRQPSSPPLTVAMMRRIDDYIEANIARNIEMSELAAVCSLGVTTFHRRFRALAGMTPHQYVIGARIRRAKRLLLSTRRSLLEIAIACGFSDHAHFSNMFRRHVGVPPVAYRRSSLRKGEQ